MVDAPVAVVTGASRGAGLGIARALGSHGCTVYMTARSETIRDAADQVTAAGGTGIPVVTDHADDAQTKALFDRIGADHGRVDILVNNAAVIRDELMGPAPFWAKPLEIVDVLDVGLRSAYVATVYAAPLMVPQRRGLVAFTSAPGAAHYMISPVYGVHKAGIDKMAADMAVDFADVGVATVSIWMGVLLTERFRALVDSAPDKLGHLLDNTETPEFTGHLIWALYTDPAVMERSGRTFIGAELGAEYGITDAGGRRPASYRDLHGVHPIPQFDRILR
ncbi:SDR family NAD(P)-dependent oxidoreductase [Mycolicibacterium phlei]|uniref:SDR family NAD(P)-dependent oxidoreductase n=1 Tax=Mycolicibacterium phlei TaxID=1771 RepID=UPI00025AF159|nr:SDR family NAD(P)-dependent oxidoreductase [Mycolicibacterium phlei]EID15334.1 dehydrogenase [Mycolicibacterium phlei RIVM601174]MBF4190921.1 dehydrogenase [Mycolicibacterium phlei]